MPGERQPCASAVPHGEYWQRPARLWDQSNLRDCDSPPASLPFGHVAEVGAVGSLRHNRHVHFRKGLGIHAILNTGDGFLQPVCRKFKHQLVVNLEQRAQPWTLRQSFDQAAKRQFQNIGCGSLYRRIEGASLAETALAPVLYLN